MNYAYYCLHKFHWTPSFLDDLPLREKAFIFAAIDLKLDAEEKERAKIERKSRVGRRR